MRIGKVNIELLRLYPDYVMHGCLACIKTKSKYCIIDELTLDSLLLEFLEKYESEKDKIEAKSNDYDRYLAVYHLCNNIICYRYDYYYKYLKSVSIDEPVQDVKDEDLTIADSFGCEDKFKFDFDYLKESFNKILFTYFTFRERKILKDFILNGYHRDDILNKYKISQPDFTSILSLFRYKYAKYLLNEDFISKRDFNYLLSSSYAETFNFNLLINRLCLDLDFKEISDFLNITRVSLLRILFRKGSKFSLWQVQALRKKFFPNYTLKELVEVC